jgi:hypothetical protein
LDQDEIPVSEEKHSVATSHGGTYETIVDLTVGNAGGQFAGHSIEWSHIVHQSTGTFCRGTHSNPVS